MTKEQIAELRRACTETNLQPFVDFSDDVLRLLDEREALLKPLRAMLDAHCTERDETPRGCHCFYAVEHATAREAIAKAEAP